MSSTEVKVVVVFDAMMSGQPTHKEIFAGYSFVNLNCRRCQIFLEFYLVGNIESENCFSIAVCSSIFLQIFLKIR